MKYIILCGGFGKRLYPITLKTPKALIPLRGRETNLDIILSGLEQVATKAILVTNHIYAHQFYNFFHRSNYKIDLNILIEPNRDKWGSTQTISYVIDRLKIKDDIMIISGDNFFDGSYADIISFFKKRNEIVIALYNGFKKDYIAKRFGIAHLNKQGIIISYQEKPSKPTSNIVSTFIEIFPRRSLPYFKRFLRLYNPDSPIREFFIKETKFPVCGYLLSGQWYDIGDRYSLKIVKKYLRSKEGSIVQKREKVSKEQL
jgi:glucose-1-phosphate thymidylyltransferase